ncbi:acetylglutamate kinase [Aquimarina rhabdastrellae]
MNNLKIIKIGGSLLDNESLLDSFLENFAALKTPKILVHGGGKLATDLSSKLQLESKMIEGRRVTDKATLDIVTMVYSGTINTNLVAQLQAKNCNAIGLSGVDGNTIVASKRPISKIDYGYVGDIQSIHHQWLIPLITNGLTPVFCPITHDTNGQLLNTNADTVAAELAIAFSTHYKVSLYYCIDKNGILENVNAPNSVITTMNTERCQQLESTGTFTAGMLPKITNCFNSIAQGVAHVAIGNYEFPFDTAISHTKFEY